MEKREVSGGSLQRASQPCTMPVPSVCPLRGVCTCVCGRGGRDVCEASVVSETFFPSPGFPCRPMSQSLNNDHPPDILQQPDRSQTGPSRQVFRAAGRQ